MSDTKAILTHSWLVKAERDLFSAKQLAEAETPLRDTAAYHCQQAAEKALKGFLLYSDIRFEKTHDLDVLISQAAGVEPEFVKCRGAGHILTPLAVEFRYPGEYIEPERDEYLVAYSAAVEIFKFVINHLPSDVWSHGNRGSFC
jgi:HEPN domain-containing protein